MALKNYGKVAILIHNFVGKVSKMVYNFIGKVYFIKKGEKNAQKEN